MTILKDLIPFITRLDKKLSTTYTKLNSWVFYNIKGGYKCTECGAKHLRFRTGNATGMAPHVNGHKIRMLLRWFGKDGVVCPRCAQNTVIEIFENYRKGIKTPVALGDCDFTGQKNVPVIGIIWGDSNSKGINIRFGREWWNGWHASQHALEMAIFNCEMESTMSTYIDGKVYYEAGPNIISRTKQTYREFIAKNYLLRANTVQ